MNRFVEKVRNSFVAGKIKRLKNDYLVVNNAIGLSLVVLGVLIFSPLAREGDASKIVISIMYIVVIILCKMLIVDFVIKVLKLQSDKDVSRYSAIVAINSFFGLVLPLIYINFLLNKVIVWLSHVRSYGTFICEIRHEIIDIYFHYGVYGFIYNIINWALVLTIALFLFGHLFERRK